MSRRDMDSFGFEKGQTTESCEYVNESSWYNMGEEFLYHFRGCQRLGKDSVARNELSPIIIKKNCTCVQTIFVCNTFAHRRLQHPRRNNI